MIILLFPLHLQGLASSADEVFDYDVNDIWKIVKFRYMEKVNGKMALKRNFEKLTSRREKQENERSNQCNNIIDACGLKISI